MPRISERRFMDSISAAGGVPSRQVRKRNRRAATFPVAPVQTEIVEATPRAETEVLLPAPTDPTEIEGLREDLRRALQKAGVTRESIVQVAKDGMTAELRRRAGGGVYERAPDHEVRLRAAADARELMKLAGEIPTEQDGPRRSAVRLIQIAADGSRTVIEVAA